MRLRHLVAWLLLLLATATPDLYSDAATTSEQDIPFVATGRAGTGHA